MADAPPLATLAQLSKRLGYTPDGPEGERAQSLLVAASELIRDEAGKTWLNGDESAVVDVPRRIETICLDVAYRAFTNPEALNQRVIADSTKGYDRAGLQGGEAVYLTEKEEKAVRKAAGGSSFQSVTLVSPYSGDCAESLLGS